MKTSKTADKIVPRKKRGSMVRSFDLLAGLPDDLAHIRQGKDRPQKRKGQ